MTYSDLFENFWLLYGSADSLKAKGSKRKAWECWGKVGAKWCKESGLEAFDEQAFAQHVRRGYDAVMKNRKAARQAKQFVSQLPHMTTWLNEWRFEEEFEVQTSEYRDMADQLGRVCDCGSTEVKNRSMNGGWICGPCDLEEWKRGNTHMGIKPTLREKVAEFPKRQGESWREWSVRYLSTQPVGRKLLKRYGLAT